MEITSTLRSAGSATHPLPSPMQVPVEQQEEEAQVEPRNQVEELILMPTPIATDERQYPLHQRQAPVRLNL